MSDIDLTDLIDRLRGKYRIPLLDGLGAAGGEEPDNADFFVRTFETPPINKEAADVIEKLVAELGQETVNHLIEDKCNDKN